MHPGIVMLAELLALIFCILSLFHIVWAVGTRSGTPFVRMDSRYYSPLALLLGLSSALVTRYAK